MKNTAIYVNALKKIRVSGQVRGNDLRAQSGRLLMQSKVKEMDLVKVWRYVWKIA